MRLGLDLAAWSAVLLVALRVGPMFVLTPALGSGMVPVRIRMLIGLALSVALAYGLGVGGASGPAGGPAAGPVEPGALLSAAASEALLGAALAFGVLAAFAAFQFGGRLLDLQIGFGIATLIDPSTRAQAPLLGSVLQTLAVCLFFLLDLHHELVRLLAWSLRHVPPGTPLPALDVSAVAAQFGVVFSMGLVLVGPAVVMLLLFDIGLAALARTMPQMNVFIVGMPIKVVVGLLMLALSMRHLLPAVVRVFDSVPAYGTRLFG